MKILLSFVVFILSFSPLYSEELIIFSGAGLIKPMEEFRQQFEKSHHINVNIHYAGSAELFGMLKMGRDCDISDSGC